MESSILPSAGRPVASSVVESKTPLRSMIVDCEGNISSGKSTLCKQLQDQIVTDPRSQTELQVKVQLEQINDGLLSLFLKDQKKYAFVLQLTTLEERLNAIKHTEYAPIGSRPTLHLLDRSALGDVVFQTLHRLNGNISEEESKVYMDRAKEKSLGVFLFKQLDTILYLHTTPGRCKDSVNARAGVDASTPRDYLVDLDLMHTYALIKLMLEHPSIRVVVANWDSFGKTEYALRQMFGSAASLRRGTIAEYESQIAEGAAVLLDSKTLGQPVTDEKATTVLVPFDLGLEKLPEGSLPCTPAKMRMAHSQSWRNAVMGSLGRNRAVVLVGEAVPCLLDVFDHVMRRL